jgi:G3E family GTPase
VVDATHASQQLNAHQEAMRQVAMADRLLITKCDLADGAMRAQLDDRLSVLNPGAKRTEVRQGRVEPSALFGCGIYTTTNKLPDVAGWLGEEKVRAIQAHAVEPSAAIVWRKGVGKVDQIHTNFERRHDESISSFVVRLDEPVSWYGFAVAIGQILESYGPKILRLKGLVNVAGDTRPWVVHCVQEAAYSPVRLPKWPEQSAFEDRCGRLVFIACDLRQSEKDAILALLSARSGNVAGARSGAARFRLPTRCWLDHASLPSAGSAAIQHDAWVIQTRRLVRA